MNDAILIKDRENRTIWVEWARPSEEDKKRSPSEEGDLPRHNGVEVHGRPWLRMFSPIK